MGAFKVSTDTTLKYWNAKAEKRIAEWLQNWEVAEKERIKNLKSGLSHSNEIARKK